MALIEHKSSQIRSFSYQDSLRAVGAWLDVRGYRDVRIAESNGELVIEARVSGGGVTSDAEIVRFDAEAIHRLRRAAFSDRNAPHSPLSLIPSPILSALPFQVVDREA